LLLPILLCLVCCCCCCCCCHSRALLRWWLCAWPALRSWCRPRAPPACAPQSRLRALASPTRQCLLSWCSWSSSGNSPLWLVSLWSLLSSSSSWSLLLLLPFLSFRLLCCWCWCVCGCWLLSDVCGGGGRRRLSVILVVCGGVCGRSLLCWCQCQRPIFARACDTTRGSFVTTTFLKLVA
jgi:hypothetical protein